MTANGRLLPCPFCGSKAEILPYKIPGYEKVQKYPMLLVRCVECGAKMVVVTKHKLQAVANWNHRTPVVS